jgi:type IV secretion system protein VirD4
LIAKGLVPILKAVHSTSFIQTLMAPDSASLLIGYSTEDASVSRKPVEILGFRSGEKGQKAAQPESQRITYDGTAHLMTIAPTGTGKGRGVVIPTLLTYPGSVVVLDPKGENYQVTARARREMGQHVIRLNPFGVNGEESDAFNLMDVFDLPGIDIETEAQLMAELFSQGNRGSKEPFWDLTACMLLAGVIGYVATALPREERNFESVRKALFGDDAMYQLAVILDTFGSKIPKASYHQIAAFLAMPDQNTRPSVLATVHAYLSPFLSDDAIRATSTSSFSLNDFRDGQPISIYIIVPPDKLVSHRALLKLWIGVLLKTITSREVIPDQQTLFLLDEAGQLGYFAYLYSIITLCRGYGLKCWTIWQDFQQLESNYPFDWQTLMNNCGALQFFGSKNVQIARKIEEVTGIPAEQIRSLTSEQQLLVLDGQAIFSRRMDYLTDPAYENRYDPNPFFRKRPHRPGI